MSLGFHSPFIFSSRGELLSTYSYTCYLTHIPPHMHIPVHMGTTHSMHVCTNTRCTHPHTCTHHMSPGTHYLYMFMHRHTPHMCRHADTTQMCMGTCTDMCTYVHTQTQIPRTCTRIHTTHAQTHIPHSFTNMFKTHTTYMYTDTHTTKSCTDTHAHRLRHGHTLLCGAESSSQAEASRGDVKQAGHWQV